MRLHRWVNCPFNRLTGCVFLSGARQSAQLHPVPQQPARRDQRDDALHAVQPVSSGSDSVQAFTGTRTSVLTVFLSSAGFLGSKRSGSSRGNTTSPSWSLRATRRRAWLKTRCRASGSRRPAPWRSRTPRSSLIWTQRDSEWLTGTGPVQILPDFCKSYRAFWSFSFLWRSRGRGGKPLSCVLFCKIKDFSIIVVFLKMNSSNMSFCSGWNQKPPQRLIVCWTRCRLQTRAAAINQMSPQLFW